MAAADCAGFDFFGALAFSKSVVSAKRLALFADADRIKDLVVCAGFAAGGSLARSDVAVGCRLFDGSRCGCFRCR